MRPSLHCMAVSSANMKIRIRKLQINNHSFMIVKTILFINIDENEHYEAETQRKYSITIRTLSKDTVSLPSCLFKLMKSRLLLHVHESHMCQITQDPDALREVNSILDNTGQPELIQASQHACVKICSMIICIQRSI